MKQQLEQQSQNKFIVMKFGGSSQCLQGMTVILEKIREYLQQPNYKVIVVVSAVGKTTNHLYEIVNFINNSFKLIYDTHKQLCESLNINFSQIEQYLGEIYTDMIDYKSKPFVDLLQLKLKIISWGEILASKIVNSFLNNNRINCKYLSAHTFIRNNNVSTNIDHLTLNLKGEFYCDKNVLANMLTTSNVFVTQGFIATTADNKYCVLTRSGSNTSASLIANVVDAEKLEIYTDVSGIYSGDPRKIQNTQIIPYAKYDICLEASSMGTNLIHPFSIRPCQEKNIPIYIKNTFDPTSDGTVITNHHVDNQTIDNIYLISIQDSVTIFKIYSLNMSEGYGFMADIFGVFKDEKIDVSIVTTSQFEVTTTTNEKNAAKIEKTTQKLLEKYQVDVIQNCSIVSIIAENVLHNKKIDIARRLVLQQNIKPIYISVPSSNNLTWSFVVDARNSQKLGNLLHGYFMESLNVGNICANIGGKKRKLPIDIVDIN